MAAFGRIVTSLRVVAIGATLWGAPVKAAIVLSDMELDAMDGLSHLACTMYVRMRRWMDFGSGMVGQSRRISREMLRTYLEVSTARGAGAQVEKPTLAQVRTALDALVRAGLLERRGDGEVLVFLMPLAITGEVREFHTPPSDNRVLSTEPHRPKPAPHQGLEGEPNRVFPGGHRSMTTHIGDPSKASTSQPSVPSTAPTTHARGEREIRSAGGLRAVGNVVAFVTPGAAPELDSVVAAQLSELLGKQFHPMQREVREIAERGPTEDELSAAVARCKALRQAENSTQPIGLRFVRATLVGIQLAGRVTPPPGWRKDSAAATSYARALGMPHPEGKVGESFASLLKRIDAFVEQQRQQEDAACDE